jgi:hypothetical protein
MEEQALKELLNAYNKRLEANNLIQKKNVEAISQMKLHYFLDSMKPLKKIAIIVGIVWVLFWDTILYNLCMYAFDKVAVFFLVSVGVQVIITKIALGLYVYQLILIHQVDVSDSVWKAQEVLAKLKTSTLWVGRIMFLQLPFWTTFYWNESMLQQGNAVLYILQGIVTLTFGYLSIWLFQNIHQKNSHKKWFRWIFSGSEWKPILQSIELLEQLKSYETEGNVTS